MVIHPQPGDFRIDRDLLVQPRLSRLVRDGAVIPLERKAIELLVLLADHAGEVLSRQELLDRIWESVVVTEDVLYRTVSMLRAAVEDDPSSPKRLRTIRKVGYQLVAEVTRADTPPPRPPASDDRPSTILDRAPTPLSAVTPATREVADDGVHRPTARSLPIRGSLLGLLAALAAVAALLRWGLGSDDGLPDGRRVEPTTPAAIGGTTVESRHSLIESTLREAEAIRQRGPYVSPERRIHSAETLDRLGRPIEALGLLGPVVDDGGLEPNLRIRALSTQAGALLWLGRFEPAESAARLALEVAESLRSPPAPALHARAEGVLGAVLTEQGDRAGIALLESALRRARAAYGNEDPVTARAIHRLALGHWTLNDLLEAELYGRQALALSQRIGSADRLLESQVEELLAVTLWNLGKSDEALARMRAALATFEGVTADDRSLIAARMLSNLAATHLQMEQYGPALDLAKRALALAEAVVDGDQPTKATVLQALAFAHWRLGELETAEAIQRENVAMRARLVGVDDPFFASAMHNLALIRLERGDVEEASRLAERALAIRLHALGEENLSTAYTLVALGRVALAADRPERASELFRRALEVRRRQLGEAAPLVRETEEWLLRAVEAETPSVTAILERR